MTAVIISNGPSAKTYPGRQNADVVIGVNWSWIELGFDVDWWCFTDYITYERYEPRGNPAVFTRRAQVELSQTKWITTKRAQAARSQSQLGPPHLRMAELVAAGRVTHFEDIEAVKPFHSVRWWGFKSGTAALMLAMHLGATEVVVYGADMEGTADGLGQDNNSRTGSRWRNEWDTWREVVEQLGQRGITVERRVGDAVTAQGV